MTFIEFENSLMASQPPSSLSVYLEALWYDRKEDWEKAHSLIQDINDNTAAWIHAYLHRKEGDPGNADYWYHRAGRKRPSISSITWKCRCGGHWPFSAGIPRPAKISPFAIRSPSCRLVIEFRLR